MNSWRRPACYPRGSFYPVSHGPSTRCRGITKPDFRLCSACWPYSQAPLCLYTQRLVSIQPEGTFGRLRYIFAGDRPSQTAHLPPSPFGVRVSSVSGWYSKDGSSETSVPPSQPPSYPTQIQPSRYDRMQSSSTGSFCPAAGSAHLHADFNFAGPLVETVPHSLHHSCGSELTRQGISLP